MILKEMSGLHVFSSLGSWGALFARTIKMEVVDDWLIPIQGRLGLRIAAGDLWTGLGGHESL